MAAYAAVVSLQHTINGFLISASSSSTSFELNPLLVPNTASNLHQKTKKQKNKKKKKIKKKKKKTDDQMAAYAAVMPLQHTINGLLNSPLSRVSPIREILESAYKASSLLQALEGLNGSNRSRSSMERVDALEAQIRDSAHKLEDVLEFHELKQLEEEEEDEDEEGAMVQEIRSFGEAAKRLEQEYLAELSREDDEDKDAATAGSSDIDFGVEMIGRSDLLVTILESHVLLKMRPDRCIFVFWGEQGSGSRVVMNTLFEKAREAGEFELWGWVRVGPGSELKDVLMSLIPQVEANVDDESLVEATDDRLSEYLYKALENRSYMIVLDGAEDVELLDYLRTKSFPDESNGSVVLVVTNSGEVAQNSDFLYDFVAADAYEEDFWLCIKYALFGSESIPAELEAAGKEIVHNCRCLYFSLAKTLVYLAISDKTVEQWRKIAADEENPIFTVADEISEKSEIENETNYGDGIEVAQTAYGLISLSHQIETVSMWMYPEKFFPKVRIISFFGMAGIGKTTFVRNIFKHESTLSRFDHHVWIPVGPRYQAEGFLIDILAQIFPHIPKLHMNEDEKLVGDLCTQVSNKRCLIVLDDLYNQDPLHHLREIFPTIRGTIMITTRLPKVAEFERDDTTIEMQLLGEEESWSLLQRKVFVEGFCPPELEKAGRKIAEKCDGLPLLILTVADQLLKVEQSEEYWSNVASGKEKSIFKNAHRQISKALLPSYHNLPQHLKPCFLFLGIFLERYDIPVSNLSNLWISEGFLRPKLSQVEEDFVEECLSKLAETSLVMVQRAISDSPIMTCRLHSVFWHLSNSQAAKSKLFHAMNSYDDCSLESIRSQRRLCIRENILLSMKDVQQSMASNACVHSFLCVGAFHQYPVPLNFDSKLMRVMNTLTIRLYEFPTAVTSLFHLKYVSLTCNGELPPSISKLRKLQCLIVKRYINIKSSKNSSYLPMEIWDMKELKHLQIMGGCIPDNRHGSSLLKLSTLLDVSAQSCREEVLKWIPNLKRLGIRIELAPNDESNSFCNLNDIHHLHGLESLKCVVVNPQIGANTVPLPTLLSMFPPNIKKLSLNGLGYPWEHMSTLGKLKNLEMLKLKRYAFQGPNWEMDSTNQFEKLKFLLLEDLNLTKWKLLGNSYMKVECLYIKHCYKLQELPFLFQNVDCLKKIELVDCTPLLVTKAKEMVRPIIGCEVKTHHSWFAKPT